MQTDPSIPGQVNKLLARWQSLLAEQRGPAAAQQLLDKVQSCYTTLYQNCERHTDRALRTHLEQNILPGLALYLSLRRAGATQDEALATVTTLFEIVVQPQRRWLAWLGRLPLIYPLFRQLAPRTMKRNFPDPAWQTEWVELSERVIAFDLHRCFYLDTLTAYGAPELTTVYCHLDDLLYNDLSPYLRWGRTGTLARGDERCDFRFYHPNHHPADD